MSPELLTKIKEASLGVSPTALISLAEGFIEYSTVKCSPSTLPARISRLRRFCKVMHEAGIVDISQVNNSVLSIYLDSITSSISSKNATRMAIKSFFSWVESYKEIDISVKLSSVVGDKTPKRKPKYLLEDKVQPIIDSWAVLPVDRLLIACGFRLGLRVSEMANLKPSNIKDDVLVVVGKGDVEREIIVPQSVRNMIKDYIKTAPYHIGDDDYIFQSLWGGELRQMTAKTIWHRIKEVFRKWYGRSDISPHWLRRSYAVDLLLKGCDIVTVQQSLGHTDLNVTQIYAQLASDEMKVQIHKYLG